MILSIRQLGDPVLRTRAGPASPEAIADGTLDQLARDMAETLEAAGGVGLAAPQVGASVRMILAGSFPSPRAPDRPSVAVSVYVNPQIVWASDDTETDCEGCLSFLEYRVRVARARAIRVAFLRLDGTSAELAAEGFFARVLQHEIDHLDGILTLDRASSPDDVKRADERSEST
jgi:peptide deformylase